MLMIQHHMHYIQLMVYANSLTGSDAPNSPPTMKIWPTEYGQTVSKILYEANLLAIQRIQVDACLPPSLLFSGPAASIPPS